MRTTLMMAVVGSLSVAGWGAIAQAVDTDIDSNADSTYSLEELQAVHADLTEEAYAQIDANADGTVDPPEYQAALDAGIIMAPAN